MDLILVPRFLLKMTKDILKIRIYIRNDVINYQNI